MKYQVVVLGGGPAGAACAIQLLQLGVRSVALVNARRPRDFLIGETIPPEANVLLEQLQIYQPFQSEGHEPCFGSVSYWGSDRRGYNDFILNPHGHGWHLDRARFNDFLVDQARQKGAELWNETQYKCSRKAAGGGHELAVANSEGTRAVLQASAVVDATGTKALFAQEQGSRKLEQERLICLSVRYSFSGGEDAASPTTHLEAAQYGWWYGVRLPRRQFLLALYTDGQTVKESQLNQTTPWRRRLAIMAGSRDLVQGMTPLDDPPKVFAAPSHCLDRASGPDWVAIGDAASAYDPITSRGITKSLRDGIRAAQRIAFHLEKASPGLEDFGRGTKQEHEEYLRMRRYFYRLEQRWPEAPFWKRMQASEVVLA